MVSVSIFLPFCECDAPKQIANCNNFNNMFTSINQKLLYQESDWWYVGLVVQKARKQGTVCYGEVW